MFGGRLSSLTGKLISSEEKEALPFRLAKVEKGEIYSRITTTGTVNPVSSVTVSTQVSGTIKDLPVDVPDRVEKGDIIARLDQDLFPGRGASGASPGREGRGQPRQGARRRPRC